MIGAIIQARLGSTRLPGKVLKEINGKPLIYHDLDQVSKSKLLNKIIIATTVDPRDDLLVSAVEKYDYPVYRGSENDVLDRYYQCAKKFKMDIIVRITSDCPLIDPQIIDAVIHEFTNSSCDYCSNVMPPTFPDGLDVEVFSFKTLEHVWLNAKLSSEREHVTLYIWNNKQLFTLKNVRHAQNLSQIRLTVDQPEDFELISKIYSLVDHRPILLQDVLLMLEKNKSLLNINKKYTRNEGIAKSVKEDKVVKQ